MTLHDATFDPETNVLAIDYVAGSDRPRLTVQSSLKLASGNGLVQASDGTIVLPVVPGKRMRLQLQFAKR